MSYCALCLKAALSKPDGIIEPFKKLDSYCTWHLKRAQKLSPEEVKELIAQGRARRKKQNPELYANQEIRNFKKMIKRYVDKNSEVHVIESEPVKFDTVDD